MKNNTLEKLLSEVNSIEDENSKIAFLNEIKIALHNASPFKDEPVDCVLWVKNEAIKANDYNPNKVAPPEMELLKISILEDGYTQPIVTFPTNEGIEVVDGFHRSRVGKECEEVNKKIKGYLPIVEIRDDRENKADRIASTIRHNRARGKHQISAMSDIVLDLKRRNWSDKKIAKELGMDSDEVLRLAQITGMAEIFKNEEFSKAWEAVNSSDEDIAKDLNVSTEELEDDAIDG